MPIRDGQPEAGSPKREKKINTQSNKQEARVKEDGAAR